MKKQTPKTTVRKNTSIRLSEEDQSRLDRLRAILSPNIHVSDNKVISFALKIADEKLSKGGK